MVVEQLNTTNRYTGSSFSIPMSQTWVRTVLS